MKLNPLPFDAVKKGEKTIEMRLNDEKRAKVKADDIIRFTNTQTNETLDCIIKNVYRYKDFSALYAVHDKKSIGYGENEIADPNDMLEYYSEEDIEKYGVVAIELSVI